MICDKCWGEGIIITCCDDICFGTGHCIHGDGEEICPDCGGDGYIRGDEDDFFDDYDEEDDDE